MSVYEEVTQAVSAAIHNPMAYREAKENVFALYTRLALDALGPFIDELERARQRHTPAITESSTPGAWQVYCVACSDAVNDYVYPCATGRRDVPAQLVPAEEVSQ